MLEGRVITNVDVRHLQSYRQAKEKEREEMQLPCTVWCCQLSFCSSFIFDCLKGRMREKEKFQKQTLHFG